MWEVGAVGDVDGLAKMLADSHGPEEPRRA
jgi:hypothetical protein